MPVPVLGEIIMVSFGVTPNGYELCNGQLLNIAEYQSLYDLFSTTYGGDGVTTFGLPDLRGRVPVSASSDIAQGTLGGEESHTLDNLEMPVHSHPMYASSDIANEQQPTGNIIAASEAGGQNIFTAANAATDNSLGSEAVGLTGGGQAHNNMQPSLVINFCIAVTGNPPQPPA